MIDNPRSSLMVHVHGGLWVFADAIAWDKNGEWGLAVIAGQTYEVIFSYDGDRFIEMADSEIPRFYGALSGVQPGQSEVC